MGNLIYKKGDLFTAPSDAVLIHSCNAQGRWGSGVAVGFKLRFPGSYDLYSRYCSASTTNRRALVGTALLAKDQKTSVAVGCIITSCSYGKFVDSPKMIVEATEKSLINLIETNVELKSKEVLIHSPKINAGLFRVPWQETEEVIKKILKNLPKFKLDGLGTLIQIKEAQERLDCNKP